jgi:hypothetical protein
MFKPLAVLLRECCSEPIKVTVRFESGILTFYTDLTRESLKSFNMIKFNSELKSNKIKYEPVMETYLRIIIK